MRVVIIPQNSPTAKAGVHNTMKPKRRYPATCGVELMSFIHATNYNTRMRYFGRSVRKEMADTTCVFQENMTFKEDPWIGQLEQV